MILDIIILYEEVAHKANGVRADLMSTAIKRTVICIAGWSKEFDDKLATLEASTWRPQ